MRYSKAQICSGALTLAAVLSIASGAGAQTVSDSATSPGSDEVSYPRSFVPADSKFSSLFQDTIDDFRRLPSQDTLTWLSIGIAASTFAHPGDRETSRGMSGSGWLDDTFGPGATIGGVYAQFGGAFATYALGRIIDSPRTAGVGVDLLRAQLVSQGVTQAIKISVRRTRPDGTSLSLPSGHTSTAFATATVLHRHFGWKAGVPAYAVAAYVGASRIQAKRHFLSDVVLGASIGLAAGRTVTIGRGAGRFAVSPVAAPGGGGVSFTWIGDE
jgi:membrane-associated phospholipid phosphatase